MTKTIQKPFDLTKALAGEKVITRDGREVKIAGYNDSADITCSLVGWLNGHVLAWQKNGTCLMNGDTSNYDLFLAADVREYWVCLWSKGGHTGCYIGTTKEKAEEFALGSKFNILKTEKFYEEEV